jgi:GntR family transcriptional regulator/MocR family aminotransferase
VERFDAVRGCSPAAPALTQHIVADFMAEGHFARHIQRMRRLYAAPPVAIAGLEGVLHSTSESIRRPAACIFIAPAGPPLGPAAGRKMRQHGMFSRALSECLLAPRAGVAPMIMLSFTNIDSRRRAPAWHGASCRCWHRPDMDQFKHHCWH